MADDFVKVAADGVGKAVDATTETTGAGSVERQRVSVAGVGGNNQLAIDAAGKIGVNNFPATQPVSGTVAVSNLPATQPVSAAALPLPSGAATDANQNALTGVVADQPGAYTILDRLRRIDLNTKAELAAIQQLLALQQPRPRPAPSGTLLHRS